MLCFLCSGRHPVPPLATSHAGRVPSAPGAHGDDHLRWGAWRPDANIPMQQPPKADAKDWRMDEIAKIQRDLEASRREEERLAAEMRNNERILLHNTNELRHWRAAIQARDAELVRRHESDRDRMHKFLVHFKERLDHERAKLNDVSIFAPAPFLSRMHTLTDARRPFDPPKLTILHCFFSAPAVARQVCALEPNNCGGAAVLRSMRV